MSTPFATPIRRTFAAAAGALMAVALVTGCALQPAAPPQAPAARSLSAAFELEGRLSATDGTRAASGRLAWAHAPGSDQWTLFNPLGQIAAQLVSTPRGAQLRTADGRHAEASHARELLPQLVGVPVPLEGLSHWVQATTREGARVLARDAVGRPARISDDGWLIDYVEYADPAPAAPPRRIDAQWGDAQLRLVIDQWTPLP